MKYKKVFYNYSMNFFIFLSILSIIITFENIPIWENNEKSKDLPDDLSDSEIVDYTIDNTTNTFLYLINENDDSYFYIKGNKYLNSFKEDNIKYFTSPLIIYNNDYYFCSSSTNIIKLSNGIFSKIPNPNCLSSSKDYELKCFYHKKENIILVAFINTPYVNSFDLVGNKWKKENPNDDFQIKVDNNIMEAVAYNTDNCKDFGLGLIYKGDSNYNFKIFKYYDINSFSLGQLNQFELDVPLYSKIIISFGRKNDPDKVFIFTYDSNDYNNYNYYILNRDWNKIIFDNGKLLFKLFKEAKIYKAYYLENTPFLIYIIEKIEKTGITNFYLGAVDIENLIVLYNIKLNGYKNFFYDNGYLYQNKGFLRYFEPGKEIEICPFIYNDNTCQLFINENAYFKLDSSSRLINNEISYACTGVALSNYCLEDCPQGFSRKNENKCEFCSFEDGYLYNYATKECTYTTNQSYPHEDNIYYNCADIKLKYFDYDCYESCSEIYGIINPNNNIECVTCESQHKIFFENECVTNCEEKGYGLIEIKTNDNAYAFCQKCKDIDKYYYLEKCYDQCLEKQASDSDNICYYCHEENDIDKYYQDGKCVSECSLGYEAIYENNIYFCKNCKNEGQYYQEGKCVSKCDIGYEIIDEGNVSICNNCKKNEKYYSHNNKCEESCEEFSLYYDENNVCYFCNETESESIYYQDGTCVSECEKGYETINEGIVHCNNCKREGKYFAHNNKCEESCEEFSLYDKNNICYFCTETELNYYQDGICVSKCDRGYETIEEDVLYCKNCKMNGKFFAHNNKCEESCEKYSLYDENNICYFCNETEKEFYQDGICVSECDRGYQTIDGDVCKNCKMNGEFFDHNNKCKESCEKYSLYDENNICYFCNETEKHFYQDGICVSECDKGYETIYGDNVYCKNCKKDGKYYSHNNTCEEKCENFSLHYKENNICYFCNETDNKYYQEGNCTAKCDEGYGTNEALDICEFCHDKEPTMYYHNETCVENCPEYFGWEEKDNICIDCKGKGLLLKDNRCVTSCGKYILEDFICKPCPNETKYFFEYECFEKCPEYTIPMEEEKYCRYCNEKYEDGKCVDVCTEGYETKKQIIKNIELDICFKCGSDNKTWYDGLKCTENCPESKYASDDHFCRICFCGFSNTKCEKYNDSCICDKDEDNEIYGNNCEFFSEIKGSDKKLSIIPLSPVISTKKSFFSFNLTDDIFEKNKNNNFSLSIKWRVFIDNKEITDLKNFATGINEEIFIINSDLLRSQKNNKISLELNLTDLINLNNQYELEDEIKISIQSLTQQQFQLIKSIESMNKVMDNNFILNTNNLFNIDPYKFYYKILIKDEYNEIIPIKNKQELDSLLTKTSLPYSFILPSFQDFIFELKNNREERYNIIQNNQKNENSEIKYSFEDIIKGNITDNYSEVESIFLIMKYIDLNKNKNISDNKYELLLNFIEEKLNRTINDKGYFEDKEHQLKQLKESIRIYINYYEPKTIFSLLNKIFIIQNIKIPNKYVNGFIHIFKNFIDSLSEMNNTERLPNSDILSFFRSFDHILDIYMRKEIKEEKYIFNNNEITEVLKKLAEYLMIGTYPGETIRLVGKRISLFLSNFGKYQKKLAFSSINNISNKINYENYETFSFDDYNMNIDSCDDEGNTLLCIKYDNYQIFKQHISNDSTIDNYFLAFFSINNSNQNINEGNIFEIQLIEKNKKIINNNSKKKMKLLYDIEFPFNNMENTRTKGFYSTNNIEKDYSNITCIPKNNLNNEELYCLTYFNYETDIIKCSCNAIDEITYVSDYKVANFYKEIQSKIILKTYNYFNKIILICIFSLLLCLLIPNLFYLLYDIKNHENKIKYKFLDFSKKIKIKYLEIKNLNKSSMFSFAFYSSLFKYPLFSPLRECDNKNPKYLKHFIIILGLSYGMIMALILFIFSTPFKERQKIIDKRDIKNPEFEISDETIFSKYLIKGIIFNVLGLIITRLFIHFSGVFLSYNNDELHYWKTIKDMFYYYINYQVKSEILLGSSWRKVKMRIIAFSNICGKYIINNKMKKNKKLNINFDDYLLSRDTINDDFITPLLPQNELGGEKIVLMKDKKNTGKKNEIEMNKESDLNSDNNNGSRSDSIVIPLNNKKIKIVHNDNFQLYSKNLKLDKSISKTIKYERIKNQYILRKTINGPSIENEIDNVSEKNSYEYYTELIISYENNLSYYSLAQSNKNNNKWKTEIITDVNPEGYCFLVNILMILSFLLLLSIIIIVLLVKYFLNAFGFFIIKVWLISSIIIYLLVYPILYFVKNIIGSFLLFKFYHLKRRLLVKPFYWLFVDKTLIYIFKVRNYVTKYKRELDYR